MTLTEFLLARIAEDEERAKAPYLRDVYVGQTRADIRAKAECEAKRRIVTALLQSGEWDQYTAVEAVRHLATIYADHADYREEWRP